MITILPQSEGSTLVVEAAGKLTTRDYEEEFFPELERRIDQFGKVRLVFVLNESFDGWELGAMWDDAKFGMKHRNDFERIAMVGGPRWVAWISRMSSHFMPDALNAFDRNELAEAVAWAKAPINPKG